MMKRLSLLQLPLMVAVALILLLGMWTGLERIGWVSFQMRSGVAASHGGLMIGGVMGTLICLERAVGIQASLRTPYGFIAPLLTGTGGFLLAIGQDGMLARLLITLGSLVLVIVFVYIVDRHPALFTLIMGIGAACWLAGNVLWFSGLPIYQLVHWWIAFLVLTIVAERLELAHIIRISGRTQQLFLLAILIFVVGVILTTVNLGLGIRLAGVGEIALALWLLRYDIARRTIKKAGLPRFIAACLLIGYGWLAVGGVIGIWRGAVMAGIYYEVLLHAILLGFVFSMIFGHAPIIVPALTGQPISFSLLQYLPLALLHLSLLLRISSGLLFWTVGRQWSAVFNVIAILLFMGLMARANLRSYLGQRRQ